MKILATSDLHNDTAAAKRLAEYAEKENVDLVLILGDISIMGDLTKGMIEPFVKKGKRVAFVAGNHDMPGTNEELAQTYKIIDLEHNALVYDGIGIFGASGGNIFPNDVSDEEMTYSLKRGFRYLKGAKKKVMATHVHPAGSMIEKFSFPGMEGVTAAIYELKPDIHVCGHIHEMEGFEEKIDKTKVICVGKNGKIIEI